MKLFDLDHPFFVPRWRRIAIVVFCFCWALFEIVSGNTGWAMIFAALGSYTAWQFWPFKVLTPPKDPPG